MMTLIARGTRRAIALLLASSVLAITGCGAATSSAPASPVVDVDLLFVAEWWSEDQMDGLNLNDPPPKNTKISLERWEASDPVGTPHPEEFDIVAIIKTTLEVQHAWIDIEWRWSIGGLSQRSTKRWTSWESAARTGPLTLVSNSDMKVVLHTFQIDELQQQLYERNQWPWVLEARAVVTSDDGILESAATVRRLDILTAD